ncbi:MAG TPA: basic amino acid ABC transporter substrate-binding protein [Sediminispirochaeta sp.]|nr:basic amino acid ABC transporter substrate-binding protein [Sediminispirochaeta sp.]
MKKYIVLMLLLTLTAGMLFAGGAQEDGSKLVVGTSAGFRPFEYRDKGEVVGFDIDLMKAIGEEMGREVEVQDMDFDALIEAVRTGTIDVIAAGMTITDERKERVDFTEAYFVADQAVLVREGSDISLDEAADLNNSSYRIGVQNDTTGAFWVDENAADAEIKKYGKYIECIQDLENRNIDVIVLDKPVAEAFAQNRPAEMIMVIPTDESYGLAVKKGSALLDELNAALKKVMESETWDELMSTYFST